MRWKNGAGWTSEILKVHGSDDRDTNDWDWRLSIAEIEADGPFSAFPGVERGLVLLSGNGLRLNFDDDASVRELLPPHDRLRFAGGRIASCELIDGATRDFNMMWKRDRCSAQLWHRPLVGTMVMFVAPGEAWAAILVADGARTRHVLDGGGELLLIRIEPATPA